MHRLLQRQLARHLDGVDAVPPAFQPLMAAIDQAYHQSDEERGMLERSLELSSGELLAANAALRAIVQAFPDELLHVDAAGTVIDHRGGAEDSALRSAGKTVGLPLSALPVRAAASKLSAAFEEMQKHRGLKLVEYVTSAAVGRQHFEARLVPMRAGEAMVIVRDVTDLRHALELLANKAIQLERSNAELQQFAYVASHDLQEPLRTVQSYLELIQQRYGEVLDDDAHSFIGFAMEAATRMRDLIDDLLEYARLSARRDSWVPVLLEEVADSAIAALDTRIVEQRAVITRDALPCVRGNVRQLEQLYQNLIANALKFVAPDERPRIHLGAGRDGGRWQLSVQDRGIGLDPRHAERIFEIFKRLHTREQYDGTGIGLALCRKIVERHGGKIWVESELGQGATFRFTLRDAEMGRRGGGEAGPTE